VETEVVESRDADAPFDGFEDEVNPGVVLRALQTAKGLAEDEVTRDVKGRPVVPGLGVEGLAAAVGFLVEAAEEEVDEADDGAFLLAHGRVGEAVGKGTTHAAVLFAVSVEDGGGQFVNDLDEGGQLGHFLGPALVANQVAVDVAPCAGVGEAELCRGDAHHGAVPLVQFLGAEGLRA